MNMIMYVKLVADSLKGKIHLFMRPVLKKHFTVYPISLHTDRGTEKKDIYCS